MDIRRIYELTGDPAQLFYAKEYRFSGGRSDGMRGVDIVNASGLALTILPDRCMDIGRISVDGINCSFLSKTGYASPEYFDKRTLFSGFQAGFLMTCGLQNIGGSGNYKGRIFGIHGDITAAPAENFGVNVCPEKGYIRLNGTMRETTMSGESLWLHRRMTIELERNRIILEDVIENRGFRPQPIMLLYHCNVGWPLLAPGARMYTSARYLRPRDDDSAAVEEKREIFEAPGELKEAVFFYENTAKNKPEAFVSIVNEERDAAAVIWSDPKQLPNMGFWRQMASGDYVAGLEPSNCYGEGIEKKITEGTAEILPPQGKKEVKLIFEFLRGEALQTFLLLAKS